MADFVDLKTKLCAHKFSFKCEEKWRVLPDDEREVPHSHPGHHTFGQYHFVPSSRSLFTGCDKITFSPGTQLQIVPNFVTLYWFCLYCCYKTRKVCFLTTNYGHNKFAELQIKKFAKLHWRFAFLPQVMVICHHGATKHIFLITQALVTCFWRVAGQNTRSIAEIMHASNLYSKYWVYVVQLIFGLNFINTS